MQRTAQAEVQVGLFVLLVVGLFIVVAVYVGVRKDLFAERVGYWLISSTGEGLEEGTPVRLKGFRIGQVTRVRLEDLQTVRIRIEVLKEYRRWFTREATLTLRGNLLGGSFVELTPGSEVAPVLSPDANIALGRGEDLQERLNKEVELVLADVKQIVQNARVISDQIVQPEGPVQTVLRNSEVISTALADRQGLLAYMSDPAPARRINTILANTQQTTDRLNVLLQNANTRVEDIVAIQEQTTALLRELQQTLANLNAFQARLDPIVNNVTDITGEVRDATQDLTSLRRQSEYTLRLGNQLMQRLSNTWPLSGGEDNTPTEHPLP